MRTPSNIITNESPLIKKKPKAKMKLSQIFYNIKNKVKRSSLKRSSLKRSSKKGYKSLAY